MVNIIIQKKSNVLGTSEFFFKLFGSVKLQILKSQTGADKLLSYFS